MLKKNKPLSKLDSRSLKSVPHTDNRNHGLQSTNIGLLIANRQINFAATISK